MSEKNVTTVWFRDPGVYGFVAPRMMQATIVRRYQHWSGERIVVQPDGLLPRDILLADVIPPDKVINELLRPYAEAIADGFTRAIAELNAEYLDGAK